ncbi:MinD-like ATPase involved in chromosome partitioning or flagellar assembly [Pseudarthrobacter oxydans]|uniref:MinD/ParA family ATP-binding protein n=1 Tax=Pseudarthrobacter oxydans TaxID=1671 RepID=UPI00277F8B6F|nr:MinD/ParA family protein [Pseudarthrobacter oxydans]MDP9982261.1 MinD-like ATPase involved in chromosome partitioning or flagellar assembly [Pseudarthrobacter oxydans]
MPEPVDNSTAKDDVDAEQPELRRRRYSRRGDESDAWTGTMPIITPNEVGSEAGRTVRSNSWAEAAAAADAPQAPTRAPADTRPPIDSVPPAAGPVHADVPAAPGAAPSVPPMPARSSRAGSRAAALAAPAPHFISSPGLFVREQKPRPVGGFRGALYKMTGGGLNLGPSARQREEDDLARRISRQLQGSYNTAVLSLKGGIGKTSTTVGVGLTLAEYRGDPPCAIDANPDSGDLVERALGEGIYQQQSPRTITDLLKNVDSIHSLTALARYMHHAGRLHLIAGEQDPEVSDSLTAEEYLRIRKLISGYYSVALTDCGTGVTHNAMSGILQSADNLIIAAGYAVSGAKRARSTLQWLAGHGYEDLARNAIVVITDKDEVSSRVDKDAIEDHLSGICRQLIAVPHDRGVADGDLVTLDVLRPETRRAYKEIAAAIVDGYQ